MGLLKEVSKYQVKKDPNNDRAICGTLEAVRTFSTNRRGTKFTKTFVKVLTSSGRLLGSMTLRPGDEGRSSWPRSRPWCRRRRQTATNARSFRKVFCSNFFTKQIMAELE